MEWISVKDELPPENVKIKIKTFDLDGNEIEIPAIFSIRDIDEETEAWVWKIGKEKNNCSSYSLEIINGNGHASLV